MSERELFEGVRAWLDPREWTLLRQVRNQTGFARQVRTADAIAVSCYPSKGIYAHGFEFKVSRADWQKELADGSKSEEIGRYCARWSVVAPPGVIFGDEVPPAWGWLEFVNGKIRVARRAPHRDAQEPTWPFFASLCRSAMEVVPEAQVQQRIDQAVAAERAKAMDDLEKIRESDRVRWEKRTGELARKVREFEEASGLSISAGWHEPRKIGEAVEFVLDQLELEWIKSARNKLSRIVERLDEVTMELKKKDDRQTSTASS